MAKKVQCPNRKCKSINCIPLTDKKKFSVGKGAIGATAGAFIAPPVAIAGALLGFNGKKKVKMMCQDCGTIFEIKL